MKPCLKADGSHCTRLVSCTADTGPDAQSYLQVVIHQSTGTSQLLFLHIHPWWAPLCPVWSNPNRWRAEVTLETSHIHVLLHFCFKVMFCQTFGDYSTKAFCFLTWSSFLLEYVPGFLKCILLFLIATCNGFHANWISRNPLESLEEYNKSAIFLWFQLVLFTIMVTPLLRQADWMVGSTKAQWGLHKLGED